MFGAAVVLRLILANTVSAAFLVMLLANPWHFRQLEPPRESHEYLHHYRHP